ncbi:MAG: histidine phosphatase family protein [Pirellulales bacterium]|nr:histidine phosphatase family protein [Pirellulales bacterium]
MISDFQLLLIRHGEVQSHWKNICYGAMDVPLSQVGLQRSIQLANQLARQVRATKIFHSGLSRTHRLAEEIAARQASEIELIEDKRLQERNYGDWQGKSWDETYASDPNHFHDLIEKPETYRPPGGETTAEMQRRGAEWFSQQLETTGADKPERIIAVSHSGPIAALAGHLLSLHARDWGPWMIGNLEMVVVRPELHEEGLQWTHQRQVAPLT